MAHGARALIRQRYGSADHLKRGLCLLLSLALVALGVTFAPAPAVAIAPPVAFDDPEAMTKLLADDGASADQLGFSVDIDGDTAIVGAPKDGDMGPQSGSAYVFTRSGGTWVQQAKLTAADGASFQYFGTSVALSGDTAMIGASGANTNRGCAYVFTRTAGVWTEQVKLTAADGVAGDQFGTEVALSNGTAVVGALYDDDAGLNAGAVYVFTGSGATWTQQAKLTTTDVVDEACFGSSTAIDGDTVVIGSYMDDYKGTDSGSVYVFTRSGTSWSQQARLAAADGAASEHFGYSVAVLGDTALIGARRDGEKGTSAGAAYVFARSGATWSQEAKLTAADGAANDYFGISVALAGGTAVIGSYFDDDKGSASGSAYVFTGSGAMWTQQAKLTAADGAATDCFGISVALSGGTAVIGSYMDDDKGTDSGSAYIGGLPFTTRENSAVSVPAPGVLGNDSDPLGEGLTAALAVDAAHGTVELAADGSFTYTPDAGYSGTDSFTYTASDQWLSSPPATVTITIEGVHDAPVALEDPEIAKVLASDGEANDYLGLSVAISGDTAVIGAHGDDDKAASAGAAYVYVREGGSWTQQAKLTASDGATDDLFGTAVAISGDTVVVGVSNDDDKGMDSGSAYVFTRSGTVWTQQAKLTASDGAFNDRFATAVAVSGDTILIGAPRDDHALGTDAGSIYVFTRSDGTWTEKQKVLPYYFEHNAQLGSAVALSGDLAVVGLPGAAYGAGFANAGRAYVLARVAGSFTYSNTVTARDYAAEARFGSVVAVSGDTVLVGSQLDYLRTGAAYVFTPTAPDFWEQEAKLTASDGVFNDYFGCAVTIDGDTAVIGAYGDADNGAYSGSAYVFTRSGTVWTEQAKLTAPDAGVNDAFGYTAAISGDTAVLGMYGDDDNGSTAGAAYLMGMPYTTAEDTPLSVSAPGVLKNDTDADGDDLAAVLVADALNGTVALAPDGSFTYTPDADFFGEDTFTYTSSDGTLSSEPATVTVTVTPADDAPVAVDDAFLVDEDAVLTEAAPGVLANDSDPDGDTLTATLVKNVSNGTLNLSTTGAFTYTPKADFTGTDTFTYTASDGVLFSAPATVTITVTSANDAPVLAGIGNKTVNEGSELRFTATATDVDVPPDSLTFSLSGAPAGAAITAAGVFTWTPTEAQGPGSYDITVIVSDGVLTDSETITVTVGEVNVAPVLAAVGDKAVDELAELTFTATATDADLPANTLTFSLSGAPTGASITSGGVFTWTPTEAQGPSSYDITVIVSDGALTDSETITVTVGEVNVAPVLGPIGDKTVAAGSELAFTASATDADLPANTLTYSLGAGAPSGATITAGGVFTWTPTADQDGTHDITITVSDGSLTDSETITVTVTEMNVAPVLASIGDKPVDELAELTFTASATDANLPAQTLTFTLSGAPTGAAITSAGVFTWTPTEVQGPGSYDITVIVSDGVLTDSETITVTVGEVNVAPVLEAIGLQTVAEGSELTFTASATDADLPANTLTYELTYGPEGASMTSAGVFAWTPTEAQGPGVYAANVKVSDGSTFDYETFNVMVDEVNVAPVLVSIGDKSVEELSELTFTATATDADLPADTLTFSLGEGAPAGAAITSGGVFSWTPTADQDGTHDITITVSDGSLTDSETITVTVTEMNVAPELGAIGDKTVDELVELTFTATATDANLPAQTLTFTLSGAPTGAAITSAGVFTWTPTEAQGPGSYDITVIVSDGVLTDSETITVTVGEVNVAPVLEAIGDKSVEELSELTFTAAATDADLPANTLTFSLGEGAPAGAAITSGGVFTWTPTAAQVGTHDLTVIVSDGTATDSETLVVTVTATTPVGLTVTPVAGAGRIDTAIEASKLGFADGSSEFVVIASARMFPDAISGSALAGVLDAPLLLTEPGVLSDAVKAEIARLGASHVVVLGGTGAVSDDVHATLDALPGVSDVERIFGSNRYETAEAIAERVIAEQGSGWDGWAFVATGEDFPDALGASALAAAKGWPIYLARPDAASHSVLVDTMDGDGVTSVLILGGTGVVPAPLETRLIEAFGEAEVVRLHGGNRYETAVAVATYGVTQAGLGWDHLAIATGEDFPDALAGGALQGASGSVMLLVHPGSLHGSVQGALSANRASITEVRFLGGTGVVPAAIRAQVVQLLQ